MKQLSRAIYLLINLILVANFARTQTTTSPSTVVPRLVSYSSAVKQADGKPLTSQVAMTFSLYSEQQGGSPLWSELQTVQPDAEGHYSVFLGAATASGLPLDLFAAGSARWLAVRPEVPGMEDPARILLVGVPYALKAADADTLGGKPASAYLTSASSAVVTPAVPASPALTGVTSDATLSGSGATNYIPLWSSSSALGDSILYQSGSKVGIGTSSPSSALTLSSAGNSFPAGTSYLSQFIGSGTGISAGTSQYSGADFAVTADGAESFASFTSLTGDNYNSLTSGTITAQTMFEGNLRVNSTGNTTTGVGFQARPVLTGKGGVTSWEAFDARQPSVSTAGGIIANAYGMYLEPQKVTGVTSGYGVYQTGTSDTNYLAGKVGIGTKTPAANLEVNGTAKFDGAVTFAGAENATGNVTTSGALISTVAQGTAPLQVTSTTQVANLNASYLDGLTANSFAQKSASNVFTGTQEIVGTLSLVGSINGYLVLQPDVTDASKTYTGSNWIGGVSPGIINTIGSGVTGATIGGGGGYTPGNTETYPNSVLADFGTVAGGAENTAGQSGGTGFSATVSGGFSNNATNGEDTVAGGAFNSASGGASTVSGGSLNGATGYGATVAGGVVNTAGGTDAFVAGGQSNIANGEFSFAAGVNANATDNGSFVWCQANGDTSCSSKGTNSFLVDVYGPIYFYDGPNNSGCYLSSGAGSWSCSSDRNLKDHIQTINPQSVLESLAALPISQWSMKADAKSNKHIGPMAQDFYAAFGLGETDKYIAQGDAQGVALASIKGLYELVKQKDEKISAMQKDFQALQDRLQALEKLLLNK